MTLLVFQREWYYHFDGNYIYHEALEFDLDELNELKRSDKPFYRPPLQVFMKFQDEDYIDRHVSWFLLKDFLLTYRGDEEVIEDILYELHDQVGKESIQDLLNTLDYYGIVFEYEEEVQTLLSLYQEFNNNSRTCFNRGFTPTELRIGLTRKVKVGRNAPCPCGSGNKYKKCCGKNAMQYQ